MFVSFAEALRSPRGDDARTVALPERGVFAVLEGAADAMNLVTSAIDAGARFSNAVDDVAEVLDGLHEELRARERTVSFAMLVVEADALAFFGCGNCTATFSGEGFTRTAVAPDDDDALGAAGVGGTEGGGIRFFRAYVRAGTVVVLANRGAHGRRARATPPVKELARHADFLVDGPGSLAPAAALVIRVDEEPRIR